ncbi:MAG: tetratricopeptide repeat protein, partial [Myxococcota bacterium]
QAAVERATGLVDAAQELGYAPLTVKALNAAGLAHARAGNYARGLRTLREAYVVSDGAAASDVAENHHRTGRILVRQGKIDDAGFEYDKAAAMYARLGTPTTSLSVDLANLRIERGEYDEALRDLEALRLGIVAQRGEDDPDLAGVLLAVGRVHQAKHQTAPAREAIDGALALVSVHYGPDHPRIAALLMTQASVALEQGHAREAMGLLDRAETVLTDALGPDHPRLTRLLYVRGNAQLEAGQDAEALVNFREAARRYRVLFGDVHPDVANADNAVGRVLMHMGRFDEALVALRRAGEAFAASGERPHPDQWMVQANAATAHLALGHRESALAAMKRAMASATEAFGPEFYALGQMRRQIAQLLLLDHRCAEGLTELKTARTELRATLGESDTSLAYVADNLGVAHYLLGDFVAAEAEHRRALSLYGPNVGPTHFNALTTRGMVATALAGQGRHDAAASIVAELQELALAGTIPAEDRAFVDAAALIVEARGEPLPPTARTALKSAQQALDAAGVVEWSLVAQAVLQPGFCRPP